MPTADPPTLKVLRRTRGQGDAFAEAPRTGTCYRPFLKRKRPQRDVHFDSISGSGQENTVFQREFPHIAKGLIRLKSACDAQQLGWMQKADPEKLKIAQRLRSETAVCLSGSLRG
jgi:hypothetical protein